MEYAKTQKGKEYSTMKVLLSNLLIFIFIFAFSYPASALDKSILLYFSFDAGSGRTVIDESGNGNDGTLKGNVKWVKDGNQTFLLERKV